MTFQRKNKLTVINISDVQKAFLKTSKAVFQHDFAFVQFCE